jgi:hypothetical protein
MGETQSKGYHKARSYPLAKVLKAGFFLWGYLPPDHLPRPKRLEQEINMSCPKLKLI